MFKIVARWGDSRDIKSLAGDRFASMVIKRFLGKYPDMRFRWWSRHAIDEEMAYALKQAWDESVAELAKPDESRLI